VIPPRNPQRPRATDPRLRNVPADVLRRRDDEPVSLTSPALEWTIIQLGQLPVRSVAGFIDGNSIWSRRSTNEALTPLLFGSLRHDSERPTTL
jgi:hypothetical protein